MSVTLMSPCLIVFTPNCIQNILFILLEVEVYSIACYTLIITASLTKCLVLCIKLFKIWDLRKNEIAQTVRERGTGLLLIHVIFFISIVFSEISHNTLWRCQSSSTSLHTRKTSFLLFLWQLCNYMVGGFNFLLMVLWTESHSIWVRCLIKNFWMIRYLVVDGIV
jgi:hypothetical protein